ncbi:MAG: DUF5107 domain-containing protein, partial [Fimbriimonadales bacterium]
MTEGVQAWVEPVVIPTYPTMPPDPNPMFLERRVYQGSSGKVYPMPVIDTVSHDKVDKVYEAIHIENEYLYVMILSEIGGRIHIAIDKTNDYDFIYRQNVIKPALVGLAGPWISGGIEINWPQHHRPSTFMPCSWHIEEHEDGSRTVWLSEHEPMNRMKGMHGVCLHPGSACLELTGRIYNRTPFVQTFLWWANVGVHVNNDYQSFFPPDVHFVADHAKRAMSTFPECTGFYYGVDYRPGTRLDWYKNIPVPTSYMVLHTEFDFFGGYDHGKRAGFVHVADRHIAPGKKQWTWGNHPFGWAWDRNLTDSDGPYVELMAGVYTDNQPDFSFLMPYETRTFKQVWYPIQEIGPVTNATEDAAISIRMESGLVHVGVCVTRPVLDGWVSVSVGRVPLCPGPMPFVERTDLAPGSPWSRSFEEPQNGGVSVILNDKSGILAEATVGPPTQTEPKSPEPAIEPASPEEIESTDELYVTGLHLHQYRHATRRPELYWLEALRRDPLDSRCNTAMADWHLRRGEFAAAESCARRAIERLTARNPNPRDGEAFYLLGLACEKQGNATAAIPAYMKATWDQAWAGAAHFRLACCTQWPERIEHLAASLRHLPSNSRARTLLACLFRHNHQYDDALREVMQVLAEDPLDLCALREASMSAPGKDHGRFRALSRTAMLNDPQNYLDLAVDYAECGFEEDAVNVLDDIADAGAPIVALARSYYFNLTGDHPLVWPSSYPPTDARRFQPGSFPSRVEEIEILQVFAQDDPVAAYLLGNILYDRRRYEEAIATWERSVEIDRTFSIPWRNLGIAYF